MPVDVERLRLELELEADARVEAGRCACGCNKALPVPSGRRRYLNERHRQRGYRKRLEAEARALGVPERLSQKALSASFPTGERHADAQTPRSARQARRSRPRPGVSLYLPAPELVERLLELVDEAIARGDVGDQVEAIAAAARAALERRRKRTPNPQTGGTPA